MRRNTTLETFTILLTAIVITPRFGNPVVDLIDVFLVLGFVGDLWEIVKMMYPDV